VSGAPQNPKRLRSHFLNQTYSYTYIHTHSARAHKKLKPQAVYFAEGDIADYDFDVWILRALQKQRNFDENILTDS